MFTHKSTDAWDALTVALIESGFGITRTWPVKTEAESAINIMDRAAARSTILLVCRPRTDNPTPEPWHVVESRIAHAVRADIPTLQDYGLSPVDQYLAAFGPALQVISEHWGTERAVSNPDRPDSAAALEWLNMQHHNPQGPEFRGTMEALIRVTKPGHEDLRPATNLWRLLYEDAPPVQMALLDALAETNNA